VPILAESLPLSTVGTSSVTNLVTPHCGQANLGQIRLLRARQPPHGAGLENCTRHRCPHSRVALPLNSALATHFFSSFALKLIALPESTCTRRAQSWYPASCTLIS